MECTPLPQILTWGAEFAPKHIRILKCNLKTVSFAVTSLICFLLLSHLTNSHFLPPSPNVYPVVIAAHPSKPTQFALGLSDGNVQVLERLEPEKQKETLPSPESAAGGSASSNLDMVCLLQPTTSSMERWIHNTLAFPLILSFGYCHHPKQPNSTVISSWKRNFIVSSWKRIFVVRYKRRRAYGSRAAAFKEYLLFLLSFLMHRSVDCNLPKFSATIEGH